MPRLRPSFTRRSAREGGPFSPTSLLALGVVERAALDAPDRKAALFRLEVPADAFKPGLYTCQVNVIDAAAGKFVFPRLAMLIR